MRTDLHCHVLAGIDDGPETIESSLALARAAAQNGTARIVATPHVNSRYPNKAGMIAQLAGELNARLTAEGIPVEVLPGAEIAVTRVAELDPGELHELTLGSSPWLLIEPPFTPTMIGLDAIVLDLMRQGHRIVLAHPERCPALHREPRMVSSLVRSGALCSVTASSFTGRFGEQVRRFAMRLLDEELVHNVASDAHDVRGRPPQLASELVRAGLGELSEWLTQSVPDAILAGTEIPPQPAFERTQRRGLLARLRREG
ncbi:MAG TPA: CpsB/CapC family capsule biosynthesis tyrosine phosphatase [Solirubrobacteraceae bacterium]|jgi:protein-tyrosine phosphatase